MQKIDEKELMLLAKLSKLDIPQDQISKRLQEVNSILEYVEKLKEIDTTSLEAYSVSTPTPLGSDVAHDSITPEKMIQNAPLSQGHFFKVPRMLGET